MRCLLSVENGKCTFAKDAFIPLGCHGSDAFSLLSGTEWTCHNALLSDKSSFLDLNVYIINVGFLLQGRQPASPSSPSLY